MARFAGGKIPANEFDWQAMAFEFGPAGRKRLREIARSGPPDQRKLAIAALTSKNRYAVVEDVEKAESATTLDTRLRVVPEGAAIPPELRNSIAATRYCRVGACVVTLVDDRRAIIAGPLMKGETLQSAVIERDDKGAWSQDFGVHTLAKPPFRPNLVTAPVEVRKVERRQLFIDGKPVGEVLE
jgi:hypothetical protein